VNRTMPLEEVEQVLLAFQHSMRYRLAHSDLFESTTQEPDRLGGRLGLDAQAIHDHQVVLDILLFVQVEGTGQLFEVHDIRQVGFREPQDGERTTYRRVRT
jgi:hypothetical protein